ncbi:MAG: 1,2-phenylacetyl-CoA epoxidase subunit PaaD [Pseudomonadota bacterium]
MGEVLNRSADDAIWATLADVPDPEIPVVSVVDLGIVRAFRWDGDTLEVDVTPTYSGCPATSVISISVETALLQSGIEKVRIKTVLSPAWTTDWITDEAREKLKAYGIAPPVNGTSCAGMLRMDGAATLDIDCPRCGSSDTERVSQFGSTPCKASYRCKDCLEPFDYFKSF